MPIVGRIEEKKLIHDFIEQGVQHHGFPGIIYVHGFPGSGKT